MFNDAQFVALLIITLNLSLSDAVFLKNRAKLRFGIQDITQASLEEYRAIWKFCQEEKEA